MSLRTTLRTIFTLGKGVMRGISEDEIPDDPLVRFRSWFRAARDAGILLPEAMTVATADSDGVPSARMMLLKEVDEQGFVFFTNYGSRKAGELDETSRAALVFHWAVLQRQVRVEGKVNRVSEEESRLYFATRSRGSQLGAWASKQSEVLDDRSTLERRFTSMRDRFSGQDVSLPQHWGGYRLIPQRIEFWQGRADRLHDRIFYERAGDRWETGRLHP